MVLFYMKMNILQDFYISISVPLTYWYYLIHSAKILQPKKLFKSVRLIKRRDISCSLGKLETMDKKRIKVYLKVQGNTKSEFPETANFIDGNLNEVCENGNIAVEEVYYFVALFYWGSRLVTSLLLLSCVTCVVLVNKQMRHLNFCDESQ